VKTTRNKTINYLFGLQRFGWKLDLERITVLLERLGNPERTFKSVHIAGTNGKGSTAALLASILTQAGLRTGLFTSPHLVVPEERIAIDGRQISSEELLDLIALMRKDIDDCNATFFEAITAIAFYYFSKQKVELAVVEVGLGGRFDATNTLAPLVTIITDLAVDHQEHLGSSIERIAFEKAGILKKDVPCFTSVNNVDILNVLKQEAEKKFAVLETAQDNAQVTNVELSETVTKFDLKTCNTVYKELHMPLLGAHQIRNAVLAILASEKIGSKNLVIDKSAIYSGLKKVNWPGRLQKIGKEPTVLLDVAHNPAALRFSLETISQLFNYERLILLAGVLEDKDYFTMVRIIQEFADTVITVTPLAERALQADELIKELNKYNITNINGKTPVSGLDIAYKTADNNDLIFITGSHYTVGEILRSLSLKNT